jgi:CRISPR-associated endonuclease Csn1
VHIGLNQVRLVVNALIKRYGHPSEVIVEIARDLKRSKDQRDEDVKRQGEVISTFEAYQLVREHGLVRLRQSHLSISGRPLVMRLIIDDFVRLQDKEHEKTMRIAKIAGNGQVFMAPSQEANVDARNRSSDDSFAYISKMAGSLLTAKARRITISPIGELCDPGFKE